jgi:hypothetical protein
MAEDEAHNPAYLLSGNGKLQLETVTMILSTLFTGRDLRPDTLSENARAVIRSARDLLAATSASVIVHAEAA